ncbi:MAG: hypothetical protein WKG52_01020 [Variovorax sp.]
MLSAWELVEQQLLRGARNVEEAARRAMLVGRDGKPQRKITMGGVDGKRVSQITDAKKLRRWHDEFETQVLPKAAPDSVVAQRAAHLKAYFADARAKAEVKIWAHRAAQLEELRRANVHGGRVITSADLDRLFSN